jgi:hypothetical protein
MIPNPWKVKRFAQGVDSWSMALSSMSQRGRARITGSTQRRHYEIKVGTARIR